MASKMAAMMAAMFTWHMARISPYQTEPAVQDVAAKARKTAPTSVIDARNDHMERWCNLDNEEIKMRDFR